MPSRSASESLAFVGHFGRVFPRASDDRDLLGSPLITIDPSGVQLLPRIGE